MLKGKASIKGKPSFTSPPLIEKTPPRCPPMVDIKSADDLIPYLDEVAKRPYNHGLHAGWDLQPGERVLLRVDNWHDPMVIEACKKILEKYNTNYEVKMVDKGPIIRWKGHDEVDYYLARTKELAEWMDEWEKMEEEGEYDKLLWGYGGPVLRDTNIKIQRMPFITPELTATPAHTIPYEIIDAIDKWTWNKIRHAKRIRIQDPEGTDLSYTNHDEYYDSKREFYNPDLVERFWKGNKSFGKTYLPGHVLGRPWLYHPKEDATGVIAGTTNHIGPVPWIQLEVDKGKITQINEGGEFGEKLRKLKSETDHLKYPGFPDEGLFRWWEASIGTNPHIHRPRQGFLNGWLNCLYERMRSGVIHIGFGTIISSSAEREAAKMGLPVGHWHVHLYFPTMTAEMMDGSTETIIKDGHLLALDDPGVRDIAAQFGDPDILLSESWIPAVPGLNMEGDYWKHYANDPEDWVMTELNICEHYHPLFMKMVGADPKHCNNPLWHTANVADACSCGHHH
ncbi:Leucyl aminopeptidase (aminopeptidase T) [Alteribacillus persepolensis]|uniref:Leucyl aminopeptidase (Aminopeptidase T) n=1 Tax=Alteribacillus persepolensis TaxID=568899 RepID=A0A1G8ALG7_9BACI|nr:hypothetical protein [Alteribacillus persepolensis]SDH21703.1 Leucyl aminopeptidase (aminopeptidase T) [Alteribacillus persepolensis]